VLVEQGIIGFGLFVFVLVTLGYGIMGMPSLERGLWLVMMFTWAVGVSAMTWEGYKPTWFVFAMVAAQIGVFQSRKLRHAVARPAIQPSQPLRQRAASRPARDVLPARLKEFWNANFSEFDAARPKPRLGNVKDPR
jgi:O-antigen ligase